MNYLIIFILSFFSADFKLRVFSSFGVFKESRITIPDNTLLYLVVSTCLVAPILEELVFRKFLLGYFKNIKMEMWPAIFISSLLFSMVHQAYLLQEILVFPISVILGWIFWKSGSVIPCIIFHLVNNAYFCYFEFSSSFSKFDFRPDLLKNPFVSLWIVILCFAFLSKNLKAEKSLDNPT